MNEHRESDVDFIDAVRGFMQVAGQTTDKFNAQQVGLYLGLELQSMAERIAIIADGCVVESRRAVLQHIANTLMEWARDFGAGMHQGDILRSEHATLISLQFQSAWLAFAACLSTSSDAHAAFRHGIFCMVDDPKALDDFEPYTDKTPRG